MERFHIPTTRYQLSEHSHSIVSLSHLFLAFSMAMLKKEKQSPAGIISSETSCTPCVSKLHDSPLANDLGQGLVFAQPAGGQWDFDDFLAIVASILILSQLQTSETATMFSRPYRWKWLPKRACCRWWGPSPRKIQGVLVQFQLKIHGYDSMISMYNELCSRCVCVCRIWSFAPQYLFFCTFAIAL